MLDLDEMNGNFFNFDQVDTFKIEHDHIMNCYNFVLILSKDLHDPSAPKFNVCFNHISDLSMNDSLEIIFNNSRRYLSKSTKISGEMLIMKSDKWKMKT